MQLDIQVFSDPICPWCYIGHSNLMTAIDSYPRQLDAVNITWRVFMLNPQMPAQGMDRADYLQRKFGGASGAKHVYDRIQQAGDAVGLDMKLDQITRTPQTRGLHQVIQGLQNHAQFADRATALVTQLYQAYFCDALDIGNLQTLCQIAENIGVPADLIEQLYNDEHLEALVVQADQNVRSQGLSGVPGYLFGCQNFVGGAQPPASFHRIFDILAEQKTVQSNA